MINERKECVKQSVDCSHQLETHFGDDERQGIPVNSMNTFTLANFSNSHSILIINLRRTR